MSNRNRNRNRKRQREARQNKLATGKPYVIARRAVDARCDVEETSVVGTVSPPVARLVPATAQMAELAAKHRALFALPKPATAQMAELAAKHPGLFGLS